MASMIPVRLVIPEAVATLVRKAPLTPEKVAFAWRIAVGPAVDHATAIRRYEEVLGFGIPEIVAEAQTQIERLRKLKP